MQIELTPTEAKTIFQICGDAYLHRSQREQMILARGLNRIATRYRQEHGENLWDESSLIRHRLTPPTSHASP